MPATPFHFGPALILKALARDRFSLGTFVIVQVVIDVESVYNIVCGNYPVHSSLHTFLGATAVAVVTALASKYPLTLLNRLIREHGLSTSARRLLGHGVVSSTLNDIESNVCLNDVFRPVNWVGAWCGAILGAVTHVVLDAMMHADSRPLYPWSEHNPLLVPGGILWIHLACLAVGALGVVLWMRAVRGGQHGR